MGADPLNTEIARVANLDDPDSISLKPVHGGDCNEAYRIEKTSFFVKVNRSLGDDLFPAEADGLKALGSVSEAPRVPRVIGTGSADGAAFIVMEYIPEGRQNSRTQAILGEQLAKLHINSQERRYGFERDNYIGLTRQVNTWEDSWKTFFTRRRLAPMVESASRKGLLGRRDLGSCEELLEGASRLLREPEHPALLHGDLWGGNYLTSREGEPVLIDPAVYYGDREADLAMTQLFGGFSGDFYDAYRYHYPLDPGYEKRRDLYNLYHMLNHLNMFGSSYRGSVMRLVEHCLSML